jgi:amidase
MIVTSQAMMSHQLSTWSAGELARGIRMGQFRSREAVESCFARINEVNPIINAVVDVLAEEALIAADKADEAVRAGKELGPLHGVPVTIKINVDYAGRPTTNGVVAFKENIAREDSTTVKNLRRAGAIIVGRTNVPCFSTRYFTDNDLHGRTLNPWDPTRTPGGSSGGAAAAVAAGIGALAHGNDRAGSVRYPAYCCGVPGLRPSFGRVPDFVPLGTEERGLTSQITFAQGMLARHVSDLRLGLAALTISDLRDPWWVPAMTEDRAKGPVRTAVFASLPDADIDTVVSASIHKAALALEGAGYEIESVIPPRFQEAAELFWTLLMTEERTASTEEKAASTRGIERFGDQAVRRARAGTLAYASQLDFDGYIRALSRRTTILREWLIFLERYPLLLMPVSWQRPWPVDFDQRGDQAVRKMLESHHPMLAISLLGLPGLSVPTDTVDNIPSGVQLVASRFHEHICFDAGEVIEAQCGVATPITPLRKDHVPK